MADRPGWAHLGKFRACKSLDSCHAGEKNMLKKGAARFTVSGKNVTQATNHRVTVTRFCSENAVRQSVKFMIAVYVPEALAVCATSLQLPLHGWMDGKQIHAVKIGLRKAPPLNLVVACCQVVLRRHSESHDVPALTARSW